MVSPTQWCWRYSSLPLSQHCRVAMLTAGTMINKIQACCLPSRFLMLSMIWCNFVLNNINQNGQWNVTESWCTYKCKDKMEIEEKNYHPWQFQDLKHVSMKISKFSENFHRKLFDESFYKVNPHCLRWWIGMECSFEYSTCDVIDIISMQTC